MRVLAVLDEPSMMVVIVALVTDCFTITHPHVTIAHRVTISCKHIQNDRWKSAHSL